MSSVPRLSLLFVLLVVPAAAQQIRQCLCSELQQCHASFRPRKEACVAECFGQLESNVNLAVVSRCFQQEQEGGSCFQRQLHGQICADRPGYFVDASNNAMRPGFGRNGARGGWGRRRFGGGGMFGGQSNSFMTCMMTCLRRDQQGGRHHFCARQLGCGVNRPAPGAFSQVWQSCRGEMEARKQRICACLAAAGDTSICSEGMRGFGWAFG